MISSLTGFGRASLTDEAGRVSVELKSVNNRFLQIDLHLPYGYNWADGLIRQYLTGRISRGKVHLNLDVADYNPDQDVIINNVNKAIERDKEAVLIIDNMIFDDFGLNADEIKNIISCIK